jgi:hypothetical protein
MSVAFYIVLDHQNTGFDTFVNGKALAHCDELEAILKKLALKDIYGYVEDDIGEFLDDEIGDDEDFREEMMVDCSKYQWFTAREGITYFSKIKSYLQRHTLDVENADYIISDLDEYIELLNKAASIGAKWHLRMDI